MYREKIGGLVVIDAKDAVVGIITETDIFKCFVDVMGLAEGKTRLTIGGANKVGVLHEITGVFEELNINISSMVILAAPEEQAELIIRADVVDVAPLTKRLSEQGYQVLHVVQIG
jgi:acetoin utilization protein AcuB